MNKSIKLYFEIGKKAGKFQFLDGLRAIAILLVLMRHIVHYWPNEITNISTLGFAFNGWLGVDLFFVLSGFLIFHHLIEKWPKSGKSDYLKRYFIKRGLRILPLYIAIILLVSFGLIPFYQPVSEITHQVISYHIL